MSNQEKARGFKIKRSKYPNIKIDSVYMLQSLLEGFFKPEKINITNISLSKDAQYWTVYFENEFSDSQFHKLRQKLNRCLKEFDRSGG